MSPSPELLGSLQGNDDPDALVLLQMVQIGSDLQKPHSPEFAFEAETEPSARALAKELAELDYLVEIYPPDQDSSAYQVIAHRSMVLELAPLMKLTRQFEALAVRHGAIYDGWGAEIVE
jgi:hypothetical protein